EVVRLVEVELVLERPLQRGQAGYGETAGAVDEVCDRDSAQPERNGERGREALLPARRLGDGERWSNVLEPIRHGRPYRPELDPAADHCEHREDANRHEHRPRALLAVMCVVMLAYQGVR